jgi:hypothetical protein
VGEREKGRKGKRKKISERVALKIAIEIEV